MKTVPTGDTETIMQKQKDQLNFLLWIIDIITGIPLEFNSAFKWLRQ